MNAASTAAERSEARRAPKPELRSRLPGPHVAATASFEADGGRSPVHGGHHPIPESFHSASGTCVGCVGNTISGESGPEVRV